MIKHLRKIVQAGWGLLSNGYIKGFLPGAPRLYTGALKHFCVPGLNCYSCPGALGACPIGALQAVLTERHRRFPFFVLGYLAAVGLLAGRFICGWLCLFGLLQELLYKVPTPKLTVPEKICPCSTAQNTARAFPSSASTSARQVRWKAVCSRCS